MSKKQNEGIYFLMILHLLCRFKNIPKRHIKNTDFLLFQLDCVALNTSGGDNVT